MAPPSKHAGASKDRRKPNTAAPAVASTSPFKLSMVVTLKATPQKLRAIVDPDFVEEDSPIKETKESPADASTALPVAPNSNAENASDSTPGTPANGTPAPQSAAMAPPAEGPKKKGVKRSATAALNGNGEPKVRGKPGPKKKQRL